VKAYKSRRILPQYASGCYSKPLGLEQGLFIERLRYIVIVISLRFPISFFSRSEERSGAAI
jgi:hypothetical protein